MSLFGEDNLIVQDMVVYKAFYKDLSTALESKFGMMSDHQRYHDLTTPNLFARKYAEGKGSKNNIVLRIAWRVCLWDSRSIAVVKPIADALNRHFERDVPKVYPPDLKVKKSGYE